MNLSQRIVALLASIVLAALPGTAHAQSQPLPVVIVQTSNVTLPMGEVTILSTDGARLPVSLAGSVRVGDDSISVNHSCTTPCELHVPPGQYQVRSRPPALDDWVTVRQGAQRIWIQRTHGRAGFRAMSIAGPITIPVGLFVALVGAVMNICILCESATNPGDPWIAFGLIMAGAGLVTTFAGGALRGSTHGSVVPEPSSFARVLHRVHVGAAIAGGGGIAAIGVDF